LLVVEASRAEKLKQVLDREFERIRAELFATEPGMKYSLNTADLPDTMLDVEVQERLTAAIMACPNGVIRMDDRMSGLVETSSNLAVVYSDAEKAVVELSFLIRSSVDSAKTVLGERLEALFILAGAKTRFSGVYPGWKPDMDSVILGVMQRVYQDRFGKMPEVKAIHAGLECGLLGGSYPHWDMISFGPTICFPHSPDEKVHIGSVGRFWTFLLETLKEIPRK
ncbi:MAG: cytosol nonspecific dipeptidase, partial [Mangrovibacterium sp.]